MKEVEKEHEKVLKEKEEEKRDMEKDIKKLLKHIDKLRKKLAALEGELRKLQEIVSPKLIRLMVIASLVKVSFCHKNFHCSYD